MLDGSQVGPYNLVDVRGWIQAGYVKMDDPAWYEGCEDWVKIKDIPGIKTESKGHNLTGHLLPPFEAYVGNEPYVFISYAHKDSEQVFKEISSLNSAGYKIWYDEGIEASTEWPEEIANAVLGCSAFLVFVTPNSTASVNCRNEINLALNEDKPFLAVHLKESTLPPGLRLRMGDLQAILKYKNPEDRYLKKLHDTLDQLLGKTGRRSNAPKRSANAPNSIEIKSGESSKVSPKKGWIKWCIATAISVVAAFGAYHYLSKDSVQQKESLPDFAVGKPWEIPSIGAEMVWCPPGRFNMGSPVSELGRNEDELEREIIFTQGFFIGKYEVTQTEWEEVMKTSPSKFSGANLPVDSVSWNMANEFCQKLNEIESTAGRLPNGWEYQLPTEAQWEYACRAGTSSVFPWGDSISEKRANYSITGLEETMPKGSYPGNAWGIHDMLGNVSEWCKDWYGPFLKSDNTDPRGPELGTYRVVRGNAWVDESDKMRVARRVYKRMNLIHSAQGFRISLVPNEILSEEKSLKTEQVDTMNGLVGWWKFDDSEGIKAVDSSGKNHHAVLSNFASSPNPWVPGPMGGALHFDGLDDYLEVADFKGITGSESRSIALWLKTNFHDSTVLSWGEKKDSRKWLVRIKKEFGTNGLIHLDIEGSYVLTDSLLDKDWNHIAMVLPADQNSVRSLKFYINGNPIGKNFINAKRSIDSSDMNNLVIGKDLFSEYSNFQGMMDDLRIYNREIQAEEILEIFNSGKSPSSSVELTGSADSEKNLTDGLMGWWKFDPTIGLEAPDFTKNHPSAQLKGFTSQDRHWVKGQVKNALLLDGIDDYVDLGPFRWGGEFSISGWVQFQTFDGKSSVLDFGNGESKQNVIVGNQSNGSAIYFSKYYANASQTISFDDFWERNEWVHFCVLGLPNGQSVIFKDGELMKSLNLEFSPEILRKNQYIGRSNTNTDRYFKGLIDDLRIYRRVLSSNEIRALKAWTELEEKAETLDQKKKDDAFPDIQRGLFAWWEFDEKTGDKLSDSSGQQRHGTLIGYSSEQKKWSPGPIGGALFFDGEDDFVDLVGFSWGGEMSVSLWAKFESPKSWARIFEFGDGRKEDNLLLTSAGEFSTMRFENWQGKNEEYLSQEDFWKLNQWVHFAGSVDRVGNTKVFLNGVEQISKAKDFAETKFRTKQFIGKSYWTNTSNFHGTLDDFRLYDRALLNEEVEEIFELGDFESLQLREEEVKRGIEMKEAEVQASDPNARFSKELLEAVRNWRRIPNSVFPLYGVQVLRPLQAKMFGDEEMARRNKTPSTKELLQYANKGLNITNVDDAKLAVSTYLDVNKEIIIIAAEEDRLTFTMTRGSRMKGYLKMDDTNFKDKVAELFELRNSGN